jgi:hypothetical protein
VEGLREEALDLARAIDGQLVLRRQLVHPQDGDDVAQLLVLLQGHLNRAGNRIVFFTDDLRVELTRRRVERVDGRIDTQRSNVTRQNDGRVEVQEGRRRRRIGEVVGRDIHRLDRGNRTDLGRRDAFLEAAHFFGQGRLIAHRRRHPAKQCRHFRTSERVAIDVVDKEEDVAAVVAEALGHGQAGQGDAKAVSWRLVHLAEDHRHLVEDVGVLHFVVEVVTLASTLANTGKNRETRVLLGDVVDQLHHVHGLADTGTAEQTDFAALGKRTDEVDNLDACFQKVDRRRELVKFRRQLVNLAPLIGADWTGFVDRPPEDVHDPTDGRVTYRNGNPGTGIVDFHAAAQAVGGAHGNRAHDAVAQLLLDFEHQIGFAHVRLFSLVELKRVVDMRHGVTRELDVHDGADTLNYVSLIHGCIPNQ